MMPCCELLMQCCLKIQLKHVLYLFSVKPSSDDEISTVDENMDSGSIVGLWGRLVRSARKLHHPALAQLLARAPTICATAS